MEPTTPHAGRPERGRWTARLRHRVVNATAATDRGDVPGWVLVTIMTAGLVIALWAIAGTTLTEVFDSAIKRVADFG